VVAVVLNLTSFGPWREVTRAAALATPPERILTVVDGDGDELGGMVGVRIVNALSYWRSSKPLPADLVVDDLWFDGVTGWPVASDE
jgi:hypothetical protein